MKKKFQIDPALIQLKYFIMLIATGYFILLPLPSFSYSIGGYFTTHYGVYNWSITQPTSVSNYVLTIQKPPAKSRPIMPGGGLIWDADFYKKQFMFRQNLGMEAMISNQYKMTELTFANTFAYVPLTTDSFSIWFGLQLNLHYIWGKDAKIYYGLYDNQFYTGIPVSIKRSYGFVTIGPGFIIGADYNINKNIKLSFEAGINICASVFGQSRQIGYVDASLYNYEGYISISAMYRFGEKSTPEEID